MAPEIVAVAKLLSPVAQAVAPILWQKVRSKLNPSELEKALIAGMTAAQEKYSSQGLQPGLFYKCDDKQTRDFLERVFKHPVVLGELEKPLNNDGLLNINCLIKAFEQVEAELNIELYKSILEDWLKEFSKTYFNNTSNYLKFQVAKEDYFTQLAIRFDDVKFAGIPVPGQEVEKSEKLAYIFVMPDVMEERNYRQLKFKVEVKQDQVDNFRSHLEQLAQEHQLNIVSIKTGNRQDELIREQRQLAQLDNSSGKKFLAAQLLNQTQSWRCVLLGAPGSGKTILMSYLAVMLAQKQADKLGLDTETDWLPIMIQMRDLVRQPDISILDYARQFAEKNMSVKSLPSGFFEYWLEDGRAVILLDGLDEVAEESKRYDVVQRIENFLGQFDRNRAIITSRPAGYRRDFFRTDEFPHYQLQSFDDAKVEEFIKHWYDSRIQDKAEAERRKDSLRKALNENDRIKLLARNPLLLTIIALIHRYQAHLPRQRYKLYEKAVETLLVAWDANKELSNDGVLKYLELDDLRRLMEHLAKWIHTQGSTGDKEGGTLIDRDELIEQLSQEIKTLKGIKLYEAKEEARRFVEFMRERTGLLNEQGQDCYAFVHKTFQEYLCAQEINYQADNEGDFDIVLDCIAEHLHDPHWREVLLLLIAQQKPKKAAKAIRKVLNRGSEYECWLHRDLLFAGNCLAEDIKNLKVEDGKLCREILERLVELAISDKSRLGYSLSHQVFKVICSLGETEFESETLQLLKEKADSINKVQLQKYRAALGEKEEAIAIILAELQDEDFNVRSGAAYALSELGHSSKLVIQGLVARLKDEDFTIRLNAAEALGNLGDNSELVLQELLERSQHERVWISPASRALVKLGKNSDLVLKKLLLLVQDNTSAVSDNATYALRELGHPSEQILETILPKLEDQDASARLSAVRALGYLEVVPEPVIEGLLSLLKDEEADVRSASAYRLYKLGQTSAAVVQGLLSRLEDEEAEVRSCAALALGKLGKDSDIVTQKLLDLLQDESYRVRQWAADGLGELGKASEPVIQGLVCRLEDESAEVRSDSVRALAKLSKASEPVIQGLVYRLEDESAEVRSDAAKALIDLGNVSEIVVDKLLALLNDRYYWRAADALRELGKKSVDVKPAVIQWIEQHRDSEYVGKGIDVLWNLVES